MGESTSTDTQIEEFEGVAARPPKPLSEETRDFLRNRRKYLRDAGLLPPEQPKPPKKDEPPSSEPDQPK